MGLLGRIGQGIVTGGLSEAARAIGKDRLLGGANASTNPSDYNAPLAHQQQLDELIKRGIGRVEGQQAPQIAGGPQDQWRAMQMAQAQQLQNIASGQAKGAGELAAERQAQNALAGQQALAAMRGAGGAGQLAAARQSAAIGSNAAGMGRQAALADQAQAQGLLGQVTGQGRGQDLTFGGQNAQLQQQQLGMNQQGYQQFINSLLGMDQAQLQAQLAAMQAALGKPGLLGPLLSAGGQIAGAGMAASDENLKTDIKPAGAEVDRMLANLKPFEYSYKNPDKHGQGSRVGVMAQHMRASPLGGTAVTEREDGLYLDVGKALSLALASTARLDERLRAVEGRR